MNHFNDLCGATAYNVTLLCKATLIRNLNYDILIKDTLNNKSTESNVLSQTPILRL